MNYKLDTSIGNDFNTVAKKAKEIAIEKNVIAEFEFNECICLVNSTTNLEWLFRDYMNHWTMDWKTIGTDCVSEYSDEVKAELEKRNKLKEEKRELKQIEHKKKEDAERLAFTLKTKDVIVEFSNIEDWELGKSKNTDGYGACIYEYVEGWAKLMQVEMSKGKLLKDVAEKTSFEMGFLGITGFMYGASVQVLSQCWKYGEELRKWHNKEYNHEGEGVVNPAILTVNA
jgi:hypothetical protein